MSQDPQLLGDGGLLHLDIARELGYRALAGAEPAQDPHATGRRERLHRIRDGARGVSADVRKVDLVSMAHAHIIAYMYAHRCMGRGRRRSEAAYLRVAPAATRRYVSGHDRKEERFTADEAGAAGERIGIDWDTSRFDVEQFRMGMDVELEHGTHDAATNVTGDDIDTTAKIARAHLNEFPDYYTRLAVMEAEAEAYWAKQGDAG